jgi:hypothetical protein
MIVVVTGGRDFADYEHVKSVLDALHGHGWIDVIRNGGMTGADALSSRWAYERKVNTECFGAKWGTWNTGGGPLRNAYMLEHDDLGNLKRADLVVAFPGGFGTESCVSEARLRNMAILDRRGDKD